MIKKKNKLSNQKGNVILWTMLFMALFFLAVSTVAVTTILEIRQSSKIDSSTAAYLLAEAGAERAKNFAEAGKETGGEKQGQMDVINKYTFKVVNAKGSDIANYDGTRLCKALDTDGVNGVDPNDSNYCYYSQATVGSVRRKIEGTRSDISLDQGKTQNLYTASFSPSSIYVKAFNMEPSSGSTGNTIIYSVNIENLNATSNQTWQLGIFDIDSNYTLPWWPIPSTGQLGFFIRAEHSLGARVFSLDLMAINLSGQKTDLKANAIILSIDDNTLDDVRLILTFRKGSSDLANNSLTLKVVKMTPSGEECEAIQTFTNDQSLVRLGNISPFYAFFYGSNIAPSDTVFETDASGNRTGRIKRTESDGITRYYSAPYLRVE